MSVFSLMSVFGVLPLDEIGEKLATLYASADAADAGLKRHTTAAPKPLTTSISLSAESPDFPAANPLASSPAPPDATESGNAAGKTRAAIQMVEPTLAPAQQPSGPGSPGALIPPVGPAMITSGPAASPPDQPLSSTDVSMLLTRGDSMFGVGDIASARHFYERAADAGNGQAALRLGESYDPSFLDQAHLRAVRGDFSAAVFWYRRARELGVRDAEILLKRIPSE
jgi:hypothetical protein